MKMMHRIAAIVLAAAMILSLSAAAAETAAQPVAHEEFTDLGFSADIPNEIMYITLDSPEDDPLYSLLALAGYTYDGFREFMAANQMQAYGMFLTDDIADFQIAATLLDEEVDFNSMTDDELNATMEDAKKELENIGAIILESDIHKGARNQGIRFCYRITLSGITQEAVQYFFVGAGRAINLRAYGYSNYTPDFDLILREIFDSIEILQ